MLAGVCFVSLGVRFGLRLVASTSRTRACARSRGKEVDTSSSTSRGSRIHLQSAKRLTSLLDFIARRIFDPDAPIPRLGKRVFDIVASCAREMRVHMCVCPRYSHAYACVCMRPREVKPASTRMCLRVLHTSCLRTCVCAPAAVCACLYACPPAHTLECVCSVGPAKEIQEGKPIYRQPKVPSDRKSAFSGVSGGTSLKKSRRESETQVMRVVTVNGHLKLN